MRRKHKREGEREKRAGCGGEGEGEPDWSESNKVGSQDAKNLAGNRGAIGRVT